MAFFSLGYFCGSWDRALISDWNFRKGIPSEVYNVPLQELGGDFISCWVLVSRDVETRMSDNVGSLSF